MDSKVYYGEYSLRHWIDLILSGNITLPEYQRSFVWKEDAVKDFLNALKHKEFIPPIILGNFQEKNNYIIDGQQRLSSLFLGYIGKMPKSEKFKMSDFIQFADADDSPEEEDENYEPIEWKFSFLIHKDKNNTKDSILNEINSKTPDKYTDLNLGIEIDEILDDTYLGFSYIVPLEDVNQQQKFYCSVFRNINIKGTSLLPQESRRSLYFLDAEKSKFFDWDGFKNYKILNNNRTRSIDFIRYVSLASQYAKTENVDLLMKKFAPRGGKDEEYYAIYISEVIDERDNPMFKPFSEIFNTVDYQICLDNFKNLLSKLELETKYNSIIETDITFFGLIYYGLICKRQFKMNLKEELKSKIKEQLSSYKDLENEDNRRQERNPNLLRYIRMRWIDSLNVYDKYFEDEENARE
ncbi:DUF262 domain-containing protein [Treponema sp.]|uniref:DUF262 domain-containing protein n=1 Tax=Treponema sp. TaxID=166 RepID=UPI003891195E